MQLKNSNKEKPFVTKCPIVNMNKEKVVHVSENFYKNASAFILLDKVLFKRAVLLFVIIKK